MISDLRKGLFSEANSASNIDVFRRNLQQSFITRIGNLLNNNKVMNSDIHAISRGELEALKYQINIASKRATNRITKYHYKDCLAKINDILNPKK
jgi:hypothetical protein